MKYDKVSINKLSENYIKHKSVKAYNELGLFIYGISEELAKKMMSKYGQNDDFILDEMRSLAYTHVCVNFKNKYDVDAGGCAASYIIGMLNSRMIDYLRSLSRCDKYGELNKVFLSTSDGRRKLVQAQKDDYVSSEISSSVLIRADIDVNNLDFDNSYIYKNKKK